MNQSTITTLSSTEACALTGITYRQLDYWIRQGAIPSTEEMQQTGSGRYRRIPEWYVPRLRLMGEMQVAFGEGQNHSKLGGAVLRRVFDNYDNGFLFLGAFAMAWEPERGDS